MAKTTRAQSPPFLGRLKLPPTLRTRSRFTTWTIRGRSPTRERWSVVVNGYGVVSHPSGLPIKKANTFPTPIEPLYTLPNQPQPEPTSTRTNLNPNQPLNPNQTLPYLQTLKLPQLNPPNSTHQTQPTHTNKPQTSNLKPQTSNPKLKPKAQTQSSNPKLKPKAQTHNPNPNNSTQIPTTQHPIASTTKSTKYAYHACAPLVLYWYTSCCIRPPNCRHVHAPTHA